MAEITTPEKQKYCEELNQFIQDTQKILKQTCSNLGWDLENTCTKKESYLECPFNNGHRVPESSVEKHLEQCEWNILGYTKNCVPLPESALNPGHPCSIQFDMSLQHKVLQLAKQKDPTLNIGIDEKLIPKTLDRLMSDFTCDERIAMYEYVLANTATPDIGQDITDINKSQKTNSQSSTALELLAQERNLKRRRAKYKGGVHTNKKSQTEILRELIEQQMDVYKEYLSEKFDISIPEFNEEGSTYSYKNDEIEQVNDKSRTDNHSESFSKHKYRNKSDKDNESQSDKSKYNSKYSSTKSEHNSRCHDRDHVSRRKSYNNYTNDYKSETSRSSSKHDYRSRDCDKYNDHDRNYDKYAKYDSRDKNSSHEKKSQDYSDLRSRKDDKSKSQEKKYSDKSRNDPEESKSHKKSKKEKKKRNRSREDDNGHKHKKSKHKKTHRRSRSRT